MKLRVNDFVFAALFLQNQTRPPRLYGTKASSSGNLGTGTGQAGAEPSRGSTPPTPGMTHMYINLLFAFFRVFRYIIVLIVIIAIAVVVKSF